MNEPLDVGKFAERFQKNSHAVERYADQVAQEPSRYNVHEMRIAIRRTRSLLWLLKHSDPQAKVKKLDRRLRCLGQKLGELRELDVALRDARKRSLREKPIRKKRKKSRKDMTRYLGSKRIKRLDRLITQASNRIRKDARSIHLDQGFLTLFEQLKEWQSKSIERKSKMHKFRIAMKRARYIFEAADLEAKSLKGLQDTLGSMHDIEVLRKLSGARKVGQDDLERLQIQAVRQKEQVIREALRLLSSVIFERHNALSLRAVGTAEHACVAL